MLTFFTILAALTFHIEPPMPTSNAEKNVELKEKISLHDDGTEVGFINWNTYYSDPSVAGIYSLYVKPEFRNKGYGKQLVRRAIDTIAHHGYSNILLIPGAMEMQDGKLVDFTGEALEKILPQRLKFYNSLGFATDPYNKKQLVYYIGRSTPASKETVPSTTFSCKTSIIAATLIVLALALAWAWKRRKK